MVVMRRRLSNADIVHACSASVGLWQALDANLKRITGGSEISIAGWSTNGAFWDIAWCTDV